MHETSDYISPSLPIQKETEQPRRHPQRTLISPLSFQPRVCSQLSHMMPSTHETNILAAAKPAGKNESQSSTRGKASTSTRSQEPALECPRCDSPNTKFCYYNNNSLTQPRHFCKTCRRYWTKGGALRNVPIGGGCRKSKKVKSSRRLSGGWDYPTDSHSGSSSGVGGPKFFQDLPPAMDFQLGAGISNMPRLHNSPDTLLFNQFCSPGNLSNTSAGITSSPCFSLDPSIGFLFPLPYAVKQGDDATHSEFQETRSKNFHSSLATSIESLSSINQDLHWKLQQQRLAMLSVGDNHKGSNSVLSAATIDPFFQKPQPIPFQNLDNSKKSESCPVGTSRKLDGAANGSSSTEWFFDHSYATVAATPATSSSNNVNGSISNWSGIEAWSELTKYTLLP